MLDKSQVRDLLGHGLSNEIVATTVGCHPSYITELMSDETFANEVIALRTAALTANSKRDLAIDRIEDGLISKLDEIVENQQLYKPRDVLHAFSVVNNAKRRGVPAHESLTINQQVVNLTIPKIVTQKFIFNQVGEAIEVEGQTLVTMPAQQLLANLARGTGDSNERYTKVANYLPVQGAIEHGASEGHILSSAKTNAS